MSPTLQKATDIRRVQTTDDHTSCEIIFVLASIYYPPWVESEVCLLRKLTILRAVSGNNSVVYFLLSLNVSIFLALLLTLATSVGWTHSLLPCLPHRSFFSKSRYGRETNLYRRISMSCRPSLRANTVKLLLLIVVPDVSLSCLIVS